MAVIAGESLIGPGILANATGVPLPQQRRNAIHVFALPRERDLQRHRRRRG